MRIDVRLVFVACLLGGGTAFAEGTAGHVGPATQLLRGDLRVSDNGRFLVHADGSPFFYLADTAWEMCTGSRETRSSDISRSVGSRDSR